MDVKGEVLTQFVVPSRHCVEGTSAIAKEIRMAAVRAEFGTGHHMETVCKFYEWR
jgi:hypothetical protein